MSETERIKSAKSFAEYWRTRGNEKSDCQSFWLTFLRDILNIDEPEKYISFEEIVKIDNASFIDAIIPATHVLIEQKKRGLNLRSPIRQSDGTSLTPFQQAQRYSAALPYSQRPRWIITCNFDEFLIYDMDKTNCEPESILLKDLPKEYYRFHFLVEEKSAFLQQEVEISIQAGNIVGKIYDALLKQYKNPNSEDSLHSLNILCVRLVFCLYAEDAGLFGEHQKFGNYIKSFAPKDVRRALMELFLVLDTPEDKRDSLDPYMDNELRSFPYVNGGLFSDTNIEIPIFTQETVDLLLSKASETFDWSQISPTIFGSVFESTLNPETRRSGGMHYTSIENIHKVIDPLFLNDLYEQLAEIKRIKVSRALKEKAEQFRDKISKLIFLDPACGSGNFLTETYISLRRLENEVLYLETNGQVFLGIDDIIKVSINQFYGIEINDFAVTVAKTALWIAEAQMMRETEEIIHSQLDFLPLKSYANIVEGNALRLDWGSVVSKDKLSYIIGNPPFVGYSLQSKSQKDDIISLYVDEQGKPYKLSGKIDYVAGWYFKAASFIYRTNILAAFVSTNSITQGEQVAGVWKPLFERFGIHLIFAHQTFRWDSEASLMARVHCVIIGFSSTIDKKPGILYTSDRFHRANNINAYLIDGPDVFLESLKKPICEVPKMLSGGKPVDGGYLIFTDEEKKAFLKKEPKAELLFRPFMGSDDFINGHGRWCLWLNDVSPKDLRSMPLVLERVESVRKFRLSSSKAATREYANSPARFMEIKQPNNDYLMIPATSSEKRRYIPIGYLSKDVVASNAASFVPDATLYHFGVLTSNVHMAWTRAVCGRLEQRYRYSINIVYNNFPWPTPSNVQKAAIEQTAQCILDARALYPESSLADLYDELTMPPELRKAHQLNDKAVMEAYGFWGHIKTESECVAELMKMYQSLVTHE